jgi:hypothetical protein
MSENPYAQPGPGYAAPTTPPDARTSVLAVLSFVSGLAGLILCCVPVIGLLGVLFGVPALFSISASRGAKRGTGLAVAGVVLGLLGAALGTALYFGVARGGAWMAARAEAMAHVEAQDVQQAQAQFATRAQGEVTAERIAEFRAAYHAEVGAFQGVPESLLEFLSLYGEVGQQTRERMGELGRIYEAAVPVAAEFDRQPAVVIAALDPDTGPSPRLLNLGVLLEDGNIIWLLPAPSGKAPPGPDISPSPAPLDPEDEDQEGETPAQDPETGRGEGGG